MYLNVWSLVSYLGQVFVVIDFSLEEDGLIEMVWIQGSAELINFSIDLSEHLMVAILNLHQALEVDIVGCL